MIDLQSLLDDLCSRLGRSAAMDNQYYEFVAVSAQIGDSDRAREESVLYRHTSPEIVAFLSQHGLATAIDPVHVPGSEALASLPRWCFPIRTRTQLLGFLWIIDSPPLLPEQISLASDYVASIRELLAGNLAHEHTTLRSSVNLARSLIYDRHADALVQADRAGLLHSRGAVEMWDFIIEADAGFERKVSTADLTELLGDLHVTTKPGTFIGMPHENRLTLVARAPQNRLDDLALFRAVERSCKRRRLRIVAAGTSTMTTEEDAADAHQRAMFSASVAQWENRSEAVDWRELGAWTLLFRTTLGADQVKMLSPAAFELIHHGQSSHWQTLLTYLDHGTEVTETCAALHIQRATLYYRLKRVREIAGDRILSDGWERSSAHMALRLWRACLNGASNSSATQRSS